MKTIDSKVQHLFEARTMDDVLRRSMARQVFLANKGRDINCNVARYQHWLSRVTSLAITVKVDGKTKSLMITSNN